MKIYLYFVLLISIFLGGCNSHLNEEVESTGSISRSATPPDYTFFQDIEYVEHEAEIYISGNLYCTKPVTYTIIFLFSGDAGVKYEAYIGNNGMMRNDNGSSLRTITTTLQPGVHKCAVRLLFSNANQCGDARLNIRSVTGSSYPEYLVEGSGDIIAQGCSKLQGLGGSESAHWVCPKCNLINAIEVSACVGCGNRK